MSDYAYHAGRAAQERRAAETANDPTIAALHFHLAMCHDELAEAVSASEPGSTHGVQEQSGIGSRPSALLPDRA